MAKTIRTVLAVDGEAKYKAAIKSVNSQLKVMDSNMKLLRTSFDSTNLKTKNLTAQKKQLEEQVKTTKDKIELLEGAVERSEKEYKKAKEALREMTLQHGASSKEAQKAQKAVTTAESAYNNYKVQLNSTRTSLVELERELEDVNNSFPKTKSALSSLTSIIGKATVAFGKAGFHAALQGAKLEMQGFVAITKTVASEFELATKGLTKYVEGVGKLTVAIGKFAVSQGTEFEASMSKVKAYSNASEEDLKLLSDAAKEMGEKTTKTASEAADALGYMALSGWKTEQMLTGLKPIVKASEAGTMDLATTAQLATTSLSAYGKGVEDLESFMNVLAATQNNSATNMQQLMEAYQNAGGMFKVLNVDMAESATILGILADKGFVGSEAGANLNSILVNLIGANENAANAMDSLGVSAWDSNGNFRGLTTTLSDLGVALQNCTQEQRAQIEATIGGKRQFKTLEAMISGVADGYDKIYSAASNADGALYRTAETMQDNVKGSVTLMKSAFEAVGISIYETFSGRLKDTIDQVSEWASRLSESIANGWDLKVVFSNIIDEGEIEIKKGINDISKRLPKYLSNINFVVTKVLKSIVNLIPYLAIQILPKLTQGFTDLVTGVIEWLPQGLNNMLNGFRSFYSNLADSMESIAQSIVEALPGVIDTLIARLSSTFVSDMFLTGLDIIISLGDAILQNLPRLLEYGATILVTLVSGISERLPHMMETASTVIMTLINVLIENLPFVLETGVKILLEVINGIVQMLPELITAAVDIVLTVVDTILNNLDEILAVALEIIIALCVGIVENLDKIMDYIPKILDAVVVAIVENLDLILEAAVAIMMALAQGLVESVELIFDIIPDIFDAVSDAFDNADWGEIGSNIINGIVDGIVNLGEDVRNNLEEACSEILDTVTDFFGIASPSKVFRDVVGKNLGLGVVEGFKNTMSKSAEEMAKSADISSTVSFTSSAVNDSQMGIANVQVSFGNVTITGYEDIENIGIMIADSTRASLAGKGA